MNILIVKTSSLGDIIHCFGVVDYLKSRFPDCKIDWVAERPFAPLLEAHPKVDNVFTVASKEWRRSLLLHSTWKAIGQVRREIQKNRYDVVFDLQGNIKSALITKAVHAGEKVGFGKKTVPEWPNLWVTTSQFDYPKGRNIRDDYLHIVRSHFGDKEADLATEELQLKIGDDERMGLERLLRHAAPRKPVVVCPGSAWPNKQLIDKTLAAFLQKLQQHYHYYYFFVWGSPEEHCRVDKLAHNCGLEGTVANRMSLPALQNMMALSDLVIAMDSLPLHLAGTTKTATFSVFGASSMNKYKPLGKNHYGLQGTCPYGATFDKRCSRLRNCPSGACIRSVSEETLFQHFVAWREGARV